MVFISRQAMLAVVATTLVLIACNRANPDSDSKPITEVKRFSTLGTAKSPRDLSASAPGPNVQRTLTVTDLVPITLGFPDAGVVLGQGYDYVGERWLPSVCVEGESVPLGAGEMTANYTDLQDRQQIFDSIKASVSGSGNVGAASVSASVDFARSVNIQLDRRNILATIDSRRGGFQLAPKPGNTSIVLKASAAQKASQREGGTISNSSGRTVTIESSNTFRGTCGDGFVAAIRRGARLNMIFSYALDSKDVKESLAMAVSGSYGVAKGKASFDRINNESFKKENVQVSIMQVGGDRSKNPMNAIEAIAKIGEFGKYSAEDSVPLEVIVLPYRVLADIPKSILAKPLPDLGVRGLAAHYWRLADLSSLYARASVSPQAYYSPLVPPSELATKARILQSGAFCVAAMLDICSTDGICAMSELVKESRTIRSCIDSHASNEEQLANSIALAVGRNNAMLILSSSAATKSSMHISKALDFLESPKLFVDFAKSPASTPSAPAPSDGNEDLWSETPYDVWYRFLARAPWPRDVKKDEQGNDIGTSDTDMTKLLMAYCKTRRLDCANVDYSILNNPSGENKSKPSLAAIYLDFVINVRLFPIAASVCENRLSHPMCQLPDVLPGYLAGKSAEDVPTFGEARGFYALKVPDLPSPSIPPKAPRPDRGEVCQTRPGGPGYPC